METLFSGEGDGHPHISSTPTIYTDPREVAK